MREERRTATSGSVLRRVEKRMSSGREGVIRSRSVGDYGSVTGRMG